MANVVTGENYAWPPHGSPEDKALIDTAIGAAVMLGAVISNSAAGRGLFANPDRPWYCVNERLRLGEFETEVGAALAYLSYHDFVLGWDHKNYTWEVIEL